MSLLNQIYATPSRVKGVVQLFAYLGGQRLKRATVEDLLSPTTLAANRGGDRLMVAAVIDECIDLRLIVESVDRGGESETIPEDEVPRAERRNRKELYLSLAPELRDEFSTLDAVAAHLPGLVLERVLRPDGDQELAYALAWYLAQDVLGAPGTWTTFGASLAETGMNEVLRFNDNKYQMLSYWAPYLGLANTYSIVSANAGADDERMAPDPTSCLRRVLTSVLPANGQQMRLNDCMNAVGQRCPIFEGGSIRSAIDDLGSPRATRHLSSTTSHALLRLVDEKVIELELRSDADGLILTEGTTTRAFSEIGWSQAGAHSS